MTDAEQLEPGPPTLIQNTGTQHGTNPGSTSLQSGPNMKPLNISMLNKHEKSYQPLISTFFQKRTHIDNQSKINAVYQLELRNRFSVLIDELNDDLPELDNVVNLSKRS